jgi:hypothetical protein
MARQPVIMRVRMAFTIQIFHRESGFFMNTAHTSDDLQKLKGLIDSDLMAGAKLQIVDDVGTVRYGPIWKPRNEPVSIEGLATILGVPVRKYRGPEPRDDQDREGGE